MPANLVLWEARFATSGEDRSRPSTWRLDDLWRAAAYEEADREHAAMMRAAARRNAPVTVEREPGLGAPAPIAPSKARPRSAHRFRSKFGSAR